MQVTKTFSLLRQSQRGFQSDVAVFDRLLKKWQPE